MYRDFSSEFQFFASRSSGAGGQNVNKVSTKVELRFDVVNSQLLSMDEKELVLEKLGNKITNEGILQVISQVERSQLGNKELCISKFHAWLNFALTKPKRRVKTRPSKASKQRRLDSKKITAQKKKERSGISDDRSFF